MSQGLEQRILDNYDVIETFEREREGQGQNKTTSKNKSLFSDTPVQRISIDSQDYVSNINDSDSLGVTEGTNTDTEKWTRTMKGNIGIQTDAIAIKAYEESLKNVDMLLLEELEILFMGVF